MLALHAAVSLLPVLALLVALKMMDSYKLVRLRTLLLAVGAGCLAAGGAYVCNTALSELFALSDAALRRYQAPVVEELLKALPVAVLILRKKAAFLVDAAIFGFAIGAGFAFVENIFYLSTRDQTLLVWVVRGFGTGVMHAGTTATVAITAKVAMDRYRVGALSLLPGLALAIVAHSAFNHFLLPPMVSSAIMVATIPVLVAIVFERGEAATRDWVSTGFDADLELLRLVDSGEILDSRIGRYLQTLKEHFPGTVLVDMLCLIRLEMELSIRAKGILMMREAGMDPRLDPSIKARANELRHLEGAIGPTGLLAIAPFRRTHARDQWQRRVLELE